MNFLKEKIQQAGEIMYRSMDAHKGKKILLGFSGGGDSLTTAMVLTELGIPFTPFYCNTGVVIKEGRDFVMQTARKYEWDLVEQMPVYKTYKQLVLANGFPGPDAHKIMYITLKERSIQAVAKKYNNDCLIITGVRLSESDRRTKNITQEIQEYQGLTWVSPIMYFDDDDKDELLENNKCARNPVSACLNISGDCCCGAFAEKGELKKIKHFYPATGKMLTDLQNLLFHIGFTWGWDEKPPAEKEYMRVMDNVFPGYAEIYRQKTVDKRVKKKLSKTGQDDLFQPICHKCNVNYKAKSLTSR